MRCSVPKLVLGDTINAAMAAYLDAADISAYDAAWCSNEYRPGRFVAGGDTSCEYPSWDPAVAATWDRSTLPSPHAWSQGSEPTSMTCT